MFEIVGKGFYQVDYQGKMYSKVAYSLKRLDVSNYVGVEGIIVDIVRLKSTERNDAFSVGDKVDISYNAYGKPETLFLV